MRKGQETRTRVMDIAEAAILAKGYGGTSIEEIIEEAGITKSGFFYHFQDKRGLALALLHRYVEVEEDLLNGLFARAEQLHDDPLHVLLIGLKLFAEMMEDLPNGHPGCLIATYCYNERLFDREVREISRQAMLSWRVRFRNILDRIAEKYQLQDDVDLDHVADMVSNTVEGAIVMSKSLQEPQVIPQQILLLRSYIKLLFRERKVR